MKLIINADDFGFTMGCTKGIIKSIKEGIVTDTTLLVNMPSFDKTVELAKKEGLKEIGLHLTLTCGKPVLSTNEVKSLVDERGRFYRRYEKIPNLDINQVEKELRAQLNKFLNSGLKLNHIDGHHHFFSFDRRITDIVIEFCKEFNVPMRFCNESTKKRILQSKVKTTDYFCTDVWGPYATEENIIEIVSKYKHENKVLEIMSHPAILDEELMNISTYNSPRVCEYETYISKKLIKYMEENSIELISYSDL